MVPNLLITDDDAAFRKVICEGLSRRGIQILEAADGQEALDVISHATIHIALVDVHMPRVSGLQFMKRLAESAKAVPCVLMSAHLDAEIEREAKRMHAYQVLSKPFGLSDLRTVICGALGEFYGWRPV